MSTAIYYNNPADDSKHSLPSLSSIMNNGATTTNSEDLFSNHGSQLSSVNTTPASSFSGKSGFPNQDIMAQPIVNKCTCKSNANRIPRPRNAFILFRQKHHQSVLEEGTVIKTNPEVSRELGRRWRALSTEERERWNQLAEEEKTNHAKKYPGYRYTPRRNGKNKNCDYCRQKSLRQQQLQSHNQQVLQLQQDQYTNYLIQQNHQQINQVSQGQQYLYQPQQYQQFTQVQGSTPQHQNINLQQPILPASNNMQFFVPSNPLNPLQTNFQFQYNNDQDKLSPLSQGPIEQQQILLQQQQQQQQQYHYQQPQALYAVGYDHQRFNSLPNPATYGFDANYSS